MTEKSRFGRRPASLRRSLVGSLAVPVALVGGIAVGQGVAWATGADTVTAVQAREQAAGEAVAASRVARLVESHDCWSGPSPYGDTVIPGHAVVTRPGGSARYVSSKVGFAIWLDGAPGTLHAFCR